MMKKKTVKWIVVLLLLCGLTACGKDETPASDLSYVKEKGTLVVGITEFEPMD